MAGNSPPELGLLEVRPDEEGDGAVRELHEVGRGDEARPVRGHLHDRLGLVAPDDDPPVGEVLARGRPRPGVAGRNISRASPPSTGRRARPPRRRPRRRGGRGRRPGPGRERFRTMRAVKPIGTPMNRPMSAAGRPGGTGIQVAFERGPLFGRHRPGRRRPHERRMMPPGPRSRILPAWRAFSSAPQGTSTTARARS